MRKRWDGVYGLLALPVINAFGEGIAVCQPSSQATTQLSTACSIKKVCGKDLTFLT